MCVANFAVKYSNNIEIGTATIEISGVNNFKGTINKNFVIAIKIKIIEI